MAHFNIKQQKNEEFYFTFHATGNNESMLKSEAYSTKANCKKGIDSARENAKNATRFEKNTAKNGTQYYFNLKAGNGQVVATSEMYNSTDSRDKGIEIVMAQAPGATDNDLTV